MRFEEALKAMREGKKVRQKEWSSWECIFFKNNILFWAEIYDGRILYDVADMQMNADYLLSEDWEVVEDEPQS